MSFDYAGLRDDVDALLAEFGVTCQLVLPSGPVVVDPVEGTVDGGAPASHDVLGLTADYDVRLVDGETVRRGDRLAYVQAKVEPVIGATFVDPAGVSWSVVDFNSISPTGVALIYSLQLRR